MRLLGEKYMSNISVSSVKELRQRTGLGMMDCKKLSMKLWRS